MAKHLHDRRFNPRSYPASVRDCVEIDYAARLSNEDQRWLSSFNEAEYGGNPDCLQDITGAVVSVHDRRQAWRNAKRLQRDALSGPVLQRLSLRAYLSDLRIASPEDALIEWIESEDKVERLALELLKVTILSKAWN